MEHVARQTICLNYILELGKQLQIDPRSCVPKFFERLLLFMSLLFSCTSRSSINVYSL